MKKIKFLHNWNNKLNLHIFTTIRSWNIQKGEYYMEEMKNKTVFGIELTGKLISKAKIIEIEYYGQLSSLPTSLLLFDTGAKTREEAYKIFEKFGVKYYTSVMVLTLLRSNLND